MVPDGLVAKGHEAGDIRLDLLDARRQRLAQPLAGLGRRDIPRRARQKAHAHPRLPCRLMVWLRVDWAMPSFAAALVKLRSSATARNHSKSLKSSLHRRPPGRARIYIQVDRSMRIIPSNRVPVRSYFVAATASAAELIRQLLATRGMTMRQPPTTDAGRQPRAAWGAVVSMALCVAVLIASEFMPVSLLTPIAGDLGITEGQAGQAISISGLFAVITSLFVAGLTRRIDRKLRHHRPSPCC